MLVVVGVLCEENEVDVDVEVEVVEDVGEGRAEWRVGVVVVGFGRRGAIFLVGVWGSGIWERSFVYGV